MTIDAYDLPGDFVKPEGITMGPDRTFFSGSRTDGTIYRCAAPATPPNTAFSSAAQL